MNTHIIEPILHVFIFSGILWSIFVWVKWGIKHRSRRNYILSPLLYLIHLLIFYIISSFDIMSKTLFGLWADLVSLHSVIILIGAGIVMLQLVKEEK